jgi:hypothetical protein
MEIQCPACKGQAAFVVQDIPDAKDDEGSRPVDKSITTARLVLAIHCLLDSAEADLDVKAAETRFIKFLINRDESDIKNKLTEIRERGSPSDKRSKKVQPRSPKTRKGDLEFVKPFFEELKLTKIVNSIDDEIESIESA